MQGTGVLGEWWDNLSPPLFLFCLLKMFFLKHLIVPQNNFYTDQYFIFISHSSDSFICLILLQSTKGIITAQHHQLFYSSAMKERKLMYMKYIRQ